MYFDYLVLYRHISITILYPHILGLSPTVVVVPSYPPEVGTGNGGFFVTNSLISTSSYGNTLNPLGSFSNVVWLPRFIDSFRRKFSYFTHQREIV